MWANQARVLDQVCGAGSKATSAKEGEGSCAWTLHPFASCSFTGSHAVAGIIWCVEVALIVDDATTPIGFGCGIVSLAPQECFASIGLQVCVCGLFTAGRALLVGDQV